LSYEQFKEFHEKHPDLDNAEYYAEFPETNKSTIRSWKSRTIVKEIETPLPTETQAEEVQGYDEELIKLLCLQTKTPYNEFEGVDPKSAILVLKAKMRNQQIQEPTTTIRPSNSSILTSPKPIGQSVKKYGIDDYIKFDLVKNEITMEIPMDTLMDPEKNRKLGEKK
jgi:hypothetical protein